MKNKWLILDIITAVLLIVMLMVVADEIINVSKIDLTKGEEVNIIFTGVYLEDDILLDESFIGEQLSKDKKWVDAYIEKIETSQEGTSITISGKGYEKSSEIYLLNQTIKVGKEFILETKRLKISIDILDVEKIGE
jgi:hypothetical protein